MNSINHFSIRSEDEYIRRKKRTREDIDDLTKNLSRVKIIKFKIENYSYNEPTYNKVCNLVSIKIQKLLTTYPYTLLEDCLMSGNFHEYCMNVDWDVVVKILYITKEGSRKSYLTEKINKNTSIVPYGSVIKTVNCPVMSRQNLNEKIRSLTYEIIIKIDKTFIKKNEIFKKRLDKIELKNKKIVNSWIPDLSQLSLK